MGLSQCLSGGDADAGPVIAPGAGADDDGGELGAGGELGEDVLKGGEEVALLGALAGEVAARDGLSITCEKEGGGGYGCFER